MGGELEDTRGPPPRRLRPCRPRDRGRARAGCRRRSRHDGPRRSSSDPRRFRPDSGGDPRMPGPGPRPWPPPASRRSASDAGAHPAPWRGAHPAALMPGSRRAAAARTKPGKARGNEIEQIVQPGRGPAEGEMARRAVADHAVRRVHGLVGDDAGETQEQGPEERRRHAVGEILGQGFERCAADAGLVQAFRIAADDARHGAAPAGEPLLAQAAGDGSDMPVEAVLRQEGRDQESLGRPSRREVRRGICAAASRYQG